MADPILMVKETSTRNITKIFNPTNVRVNNETTCTYMKQNIQTVLMNSSGNKVYVWDVSAEVIFQLTNEFNVV